LHEVKAHRHKRDGLVVRGNRLAQRRQIIQDEVAGRRALCPLIQKGAVLPEPGGPVQLVGGVVVHMPVWLGRHPTQMDTAGSCGDNGSVRGQDSVWTREQLSNAVELRNAVLPSPSDPLDLLGVAKVVLPADFVKDLHLQDGLAPGCRE
jgi:hypothetical protein